jgi:putative hemin transport protein
MSVTLAERVQAALTENPGAMTMQLAHSLGVPEADILRALPAGRVTELDLSRWEELLRALEDLGQVHVIVSNGAVTLETTGRFGQFSTWGEFFNVQTPSLDMHIRYRNLGASFAVEKPSHMNEALTTLSLQFFDQTGAAAFKVFLNFGGPISPERAAQWKTLRTQFARPQ